MSPANGIGARRNAPPRYWRDAIRKRDEEGACRVCGTTEGVEAAHLAGREYDPVLPCPRDCADGFTDDDYTGERVPCEACKATGLVRYVRPESIVPLCGPSVDTGTCHNLQHAGALDLIPAAEQRRGGLHGRRRRARAGISKPERHRPRAVTAGSTTTEGGGLSGSYSYREA